MRVTPTINGNGTATYTFTAATIAAGGNQVPVPTGTISSVDVLIDVQGTADLSNITFNGQTEVPITGADLESSVQARRLEELRLVELQEPGPVRQLVRAPRPALWRLTFQVRGSTPCFPARRSTGTTYPEPINRKGESQ